MCGTLSEKGIQDDEKTADLKTIRKYARGCNGSGTDFQKTPPQVVMLLRWSAPCLVGLRGRREPGEDNDTLRRRFAGARWETFLDSYLCDNGVKYLCA